MQSISSYILPFLTIILLLIALVIAFDCLWRTERALSGFIRLVVFIMSITLGKAVVFILNILPADTYALVAQIADLISGLLLLCAMLLLFRMIRSLHRPRS